MADNTIFAVMLADVYYEHPYTTQDVVIDSVVARLQSWPFFPINSTVYSVEDGSLDFAINSDVIGFNNVALPINSRVREGTFNTVTDFVSISSVARVFGPPVKFTLDSKVVPAPVTVQATLNSSILKHASVSIPVKSGVIKTSTQSVFINSFVKSLKTSKFGFGIDSSVRYRVESISVAIKSMVSSKPGKVFNPVLMSFYTPKEMDW